MTECLSESREQYPATAALIPQSSYRENAALGIIGGEYELISMHTHFQNTSHFWFATGGAGFCVSRTMALKMAPFAA